MNKNLDYALTEINKLNPNEQFLVRDLWKGYEWNRIPISERLLIGRLFYDAVLQMDPCPVGILDKTSAKQQKYFKK